MTLPAGTLLGRRAARTPRTASDVVAASVAALRGARAAAMDAGAPEPRAIGISAPGPLDPLRGVLLDPPNMDRSLWDYPLSDAIATRLGLPVALERDTQVAVLAEGMFGAARELTDYVYLTVSTGIGGAVVSDGRLLRGPDLVAGELGHMTVEVDGPPCGCGARGHLEAISSGTAIARAAREAGLGEVDAIQVAAAEERGDERATKIMEHARQAFAAAVVSIVDIFNPQRVIVGGGIALGQGDRLLDPAREQVSNDAFRRQAQRVQIVAASLGDDVGLIGSLPLVSLALLGEDRSSTRT
jgi:glucokinase